MADNKTHRVRNGIVIVITTFITGIIAFMALFAWHSRHEAETTCAMARPGMSMDEFNRANGGIKFTSNKEGTEHARVFWGIAPETTVFCIIHTRDNIITDSHLRLYEPLPEESQEPEEEAGR